MPPPGRGLELSIVTATAARRPAPPWPFLLHVTTAPAQVVVVVVGLDRPGDPDLLVHSTVVRAAGLTVCGGPPARTIGPVARDVVLRYLADALGWAESHAGEAYGVLHAARAGRFLDDGLVVSTIDGARDAIGRGGPAELLRRAIDVQEGRLADRPPTAATGRSLRAPRARRTASGSPASPGRRSDGWATARRRHDVVVGALGDDAAAGHLVVVAAVDLPPPAGRDGAPQHSNTDQQRWLRRR